MWGKELLGGGLFSTSAFVVVIFIDCGHIYRCDWVFLTDILNCAAIVFST